MNQYRVSLRFNRDSSDHWEVVSLLKQLGRKKSEFITICVQDYLSRNSHLTVDSIREELGVGLYSSSTNVKNKDFDKKDHSAKKDFVRKENENSIRKEQDKNIERGSRSYNKNKKSYKDKSLRKDNNAKDSNDKKVVVDRIDEDEIPEIPSIDSINTDTQADTEPSVKENENSSNADISEDLLIKSLDIFDNM